MNIQEVKFKRGDKMITEGSTDKFILIVIEGQCEVYIGTTKVRECTRGEVLGLIGAVTGAPRTATVLATTDVRAVRVRVDDLAGLTQDMKRSEAFLKAVIESLVEALRDSARTVDRLVQSIRKEVASQRTYHAFLRKCFRDIEDLASASQDATKHSILIQVRKADRSLDNLMESMAEFERSVSIPDR